MFFFDMATGVIRTIALLHCHIQLKRPDSWPFWRGHGTTWAPSVSEVTYHKQRNQGVFDRFIRSPNIETGPRSLLSSLLSGGWIFQLMVTCFFSAQLSRADLTSLGSLKHRLLVFIGRKL